MIKGLVQRSAMPDPAAVLRSLACVAAVAVVAVQWGPQGSATAVVGAAAVAGATALQDSPRGRVTVVLLVTAVAGLAVLLGALTSGFSPLFVAVATLWCFGASMLWALGANPGLIGAASAALLVSAPPVTPTPTSVVVTWLLAVAGGLLQVWVISLWPPLRWRNQRKALVAAYRSLAADARKISDGTVGGGPAADPEPLAALRTAFTAADGPSRRRPATYRGWYALPERIADTLTDVARLPARSDALALALAEAADTLAAVADTSRTGRVGADVAIGRFDSVAATVDGSESVVVQKLSTQLHEAVAMRLGDFVPSTPDAVRLRRPELRTSVRSAVDVMRSHLDRHSPVLRHAVRLAAAVAVGCVVDRYAEGAYGFWIPLTVLMVLRPETAHTYTRCVGRVAGTLVGIVTASAVLVILNPGVAVSAVLALAAVGVACVLSGIGFIAMAAAVTAAAVFLVDIGRPDMPPAVADPVLAVLFGGALALIAHVVLPDDALTRLSQRAGELLRTEIDYAATVIKAYVHELDDPAETMTSAWQRAFRARAAFEATTGAMRMESRELRHWLRSYRTALNAVTSSCTTLEDQLPAQPAVTADREFVLAVDEYVEALRGDPPTAASPWRVDCAELAAAEARLREAVRRHGPEEGPARLLVAEVDTITRHVSAISVSPSPTSVR
ncbi:MULTISPECIES: FUSC family protein [Mycolicibacterium]|uniref:FUSC family protein n=1 Tax=Mycolicibacterium austroafricanum TaxID=39687 RepID=A0ABT8HE57_MYCAO|nr:MULTISPECIES: FUSC family protein [Mycolicibacterium]MDN4518810.1 FUSC family protein [Mycolicibacterium austroafricanum]MDW5609875.1 FUSC family protein [Mycolicibacterium sp. D5.8-2]QRZ09596.1 FUSC family protein [Mycolicibacterium austroafricanum]QZT66009.1 FUSC family protein [Mycolicibacterium austroafricanum]QZY43761.1 FUSC family protein [Mycolicibacterium austroafricanum]